MQKLLKIITFTVFLSNSVTHAQLGELSLLGIDTDGFSSMSDSDSPPQQKEVSDSDTNPNKIKNYQTNQYGYTGGNNFFNPPIKKFTKEPLEYFGYSYFSSISGSFVPIANIPVPPDYLIGPDDMIKIILFGNKNKKYDLKVNRTGEIFIPELGPLFVAGVTFEDMRELIKTTINIQLIGTEVSVSMGALRSIDVFILGAVNNPGMYTVSAFSTMTNALFESGGINTAGSLRDIKLKRNGELISKFDLYELLIEGDTSNDKRLMQGDVILVEPIGKTAGITGEVNRPSIYELKDKESLLDLLIFAGSLRPKANKSDAEILRINEKRNSFDLLDIDLTSQAELSVEIRNGDIVYIYPINNKIQNAVLLTGHTLQPGFYSWKEGMRMTDIFSSSDDILEMTDINYVLIKRKNKSTQQYNFLQVNLEQALNDPGSSQNILLIDQDEILILPSLLSSELITTRLIQDKYIIDEETQEVLLEDEWDSLTYMRKSLLDKQIEIDPLNSPETQGSDVRRYYEYSIYDYCVIPEDLAVLIVEQSGFRANKTIPLEDLEKLNTPEDFLKLQNTIKQEKLKSENDSSYEAEALEMTITNLCRNQLIEPFLNLVKRDNFKEKLSLINIFGSVYFPGSYPYTSNMSLADAIRAAGGPKNGTYNSEIEIAKIENTGKRFITKNNYSSMTQAEAVRIDKMDTVNLKQISTNIKSVELKGEVYFPGIYPVSENQTLSELIERAGGLTQYAATDAAFFQREALRLKEEERFQSAKSQLQRKILLSSQSGGLGEQSLDNDSIKLLTELVSGDIESTKALGRLVIDLEGIINGSVKDIVLEDGDTLNIPKRKQSVSVIGEVFVSNSHLFSKENNIDHYIGLSGGTTAYADESNVYIIKSDGRILSSSEISSGFFRQSSVDPGDTIVVPLQVQPFSTIRATTEVTQIIYQMALAAAAVNSF